MAFEIFWEDLFLLPGKGGEVQSVVAAFRDQVLGNPASKFVFVTNEHELRDPC